jgi:hypothetical protein
MAKAKGMIRIESPDERLKRLEPGEWKDHEPTWSSLWRHWYDHAGNTAAGMTTAELDDAAESARDAARPYRKWSKTATMETETKRARLTGTADGLTFHQLRRRGVAINIAHHVARWSERDNSIVLVTSCWDTSYRVEWHGRVLQERLNRWKWCVVGSLLWSQVPDLFDVGISRSRVGAIVQMIAAAKRLDREYTSEVRS